MTTGPDLSLRPGAVVMVRPHHFAVNPETADDNAFQVIPADANSIAGAAYREISAAAETLRAHGVTVHLFDDEGRATPDSVFPNNWFSTHPGGDVVLYPMRAVSRRGERRGDIIDALKAQYRVSAVLDLSPAEDHGQSLEGTGALVIDHTAGCVFMARSGRADAVLCQRLCSFLGLEPVIFDAAGPDGQPIYHTNVMLALGSGYSLVGTESIAPTDRERVLQALDARGDVIPLTNAQIGAFAGNAFELQGTEGPLLALSQTAMTALTPSQIAELEAHAKLLPLAMPTIEMSGGSVRCTLAGVHLKKRP